MGPEPTDAGAESDAPRIDRPILEAIRDRLRTTTQFNSVVIVGGDSQTHLEAVVDPTVNPAALHRRFVDIRWYTNDDFRIHYQEEWADETWQQRWDRHPNEHNSRDHFHPPPNAATPGQDRSWPVDFRDVLANVLSELADRNTEVWRHDHTTG